MELASGLVISERYRLEYELGSGGMGSVWAARHLVTGKDVALKFLNASSATKPEARRRFIREARAASRVRHPNVVAVHDVLEFDGGGLMMVMDLLFGETLGQRLDRCGSLSLRDTASILAPVISAVGSAHAAGVVHRDLKPDNIFLSDAADTSPTASQSLEVRVLDFGIAKLHEDFDSAGLTNTGALLGTPYYMSPEQIFGEKDIDARADVWSLGVILYECLCGRRPFEGENAGQVMKAILKGAPLPIATCVSDLPAPIVALVDRMMQLDRNDRPRDLREPLELLSEHAGQSPPPFSAPRASPPSLQNIESSVPFADTTASPRVDTLPSAEPERPRPPMLDTADGMATSTFYERRSGRRVVAIVGVGTVAVGLAVGGWAWMRSPEPVAPAAPRETATAEPKTSQPNVREPEVAPPKEPEATKATAAPSMPAPQRTARPPKPTPSSSTATPVQTSLPFGVEGKVPF